MPFPDNSIQDAAANFFGVTGRVTAAATPTASGTSLGFTSAAGTSLTQTCTFTGNVGSTAYTIGDIVAGLKQLGLLVN